MVVGLLLLVALIVEGVLVLRALWGPGSGPGEQRIGAEGRALEILEERYAQGEIDQEEFEKRRRALLP